MSLAINLATRGRPALLMHTLGITLRNIACDDTVLMVSVDDDDAETVAAVRTIRHPRLVVSIAPREDSLGEKYNRVLGQFPSADVYLAMVDYAPHVTDSFDLALRHAAAVFPDGIGVVYNHMANLSFPQINAVTGNLAKLMGGIYPPWFPYWFVDHWLDDVARMIGRIAVADVWVDCAQRPGTLERREPAFWAALFDALALRRRQHADRIIDRLDEPDWHKRMLRMQFPLIEERSRMVNMECRAIPDSGEPWDDRYRRLRHRAEELMLECLAELEAAA